MRNAFLAIFTSFLVFMGSFFIPTPAHASFSAGAAFSSLMGTGATATIESGGAVHSQARSIYSLGGGMVTFQGKRTTFLAVDPPSFSAGCGGISWHFGGFAFISMDEIRQLVEAISQAALGIAIDLAMQTLCPQCYAVMTKLRDIANAMRNAAADACKTARGLGLQLGRALGLPEATQSKCGEISAAKGESTGFLNSVASSICGALNSVNETLNSVGEAVDKFLTGELGASEKTPDKESVDARHNIQYEVLTALGYEDGPMKDMLLNITGMTIYQGKPSADCKETFKNLSMDVDTYSGSSADLANWTRPAADRRVDKATKGTGKAINPEASGAKKDMHVCHVPPLLTGVDQLGKKIVCGFSPKADLDLFLTRTNSKLEHISNTAMGTLCSIKASAGVSAESIENQKGETDPLLYSCREIRDTRCLYPNQERYSTLIRAGSGYTGLGWLIADALYTGAADVALNRPLQPTTIKILNNSGYPLYRLLNLAAVYPGMASDLISAYAATIAVQYGVDTLDRMIRPGAMTSIETRGSNSFVSFQTITEVRAQLASSFTDGTAYRDTVLKLVSQKRALVQHIIEINRALQSEVISQGLTGNNYFATTLKNQMTAPSK